MQQLLCSGVLVPRHWLWRHAGAVYGTCRDDYSGTGRDQLLEVIDVLKRDPYSRRILMTTFDVTNVDKGCLVPSYLFLTIKQSAASADSQSFLPLAFLQAQRDSVFAKEDQAKKDAFDESDDESAISRTESELREVTKVLSIAHCVFCHLKRKEKKRLRLLPSIS